MREGGREGEKGWGPAGAGAGADGKAEEGEKADVEMKDGQGKGQGKTRGKGKGKAHNQAPLDLGDQVHGGDWERSPENEPFKHKFEVHLIFPRSSRPITDDVSSSIFLNRRASRRRNMPSSSGIRFVAAISPFWDRY